VTGGAAEFIAPGERIEEKVLRTFGRLASPPVTDVEIDWGNADADAAPRTLPPLFDGDALRVFARVPGKLPETVTLKCTTPAGPRSWSVQVRQAEDPANLLPTLWARAMIRTLEEEAGVQQTASISAPAAAGRDRTRLIDLSKRYNLLCSLTSFIAIEHRSLEDRNTGQPATRRIPTQLALGWGGVDAEAGTGMMHCLERAIPCASAAAPAPVAGHIARRARSAPKKAGGLLDRLKQGLLGGGGVPPVFGLGGAPSPKQESPRGSDKEMLSDATADDEDVLYAREDVTSFAAPPRSPAAEPNRPADDPLILLLGHQLADGSFDDSATVEQTLRATNLDRKTIESAINQILHEAHVPSAVRTKVAHTLLVLLVLRLAFPDRQPTWTRAAKKALRYLTDAAQLHGGQAEQWLADLSKRFGPS
jgi:Ca-activated chloride channel family protein